VTDLRISAQPDGGDVLRLVLAGEMDLASAGQLTDATDKAVATERPTEILVDLAAVTFIDSTGIRALLTAQRIADEQGVGLRVVHAHGVVARVLTMTGLLDILEGNDPATPPDAASAGASQPSRG
jgi:anti-anti-sigma factor